MRFSVAERHDRVTLLQMGFLSCAHRRQTGWRWTLMRVVSAETEWVAQEKVILLL